MAEYGFKEGTQMRWNVLGVPKDESVFEAFTDLVNIFDGMIPTLKAVGTLDPDQIVRYLILVYHTKSPLIVGEENILSRKKRAMLIVGAKVDSKGFFGEGVNSIIANKNMAVIDLKMRFLRFENNIVWTQLCNVTELWYENQRIMGAAIAEDGKKSPDEIMKIRLSTQKDSEVLEAKMEKLSEKLFIGDLDLMNYVGSTIIMEERKLRLTPESRAI